MLKATALPQQSPDAYFYPVNKEHSQESVLCFREILGHPGTIPLEGKYILI